jgi:hypothetical protein
VSRRPEMEWDTARSGFGACKRWIDGWIFVFRFLWIGLDCNAKEVALCSENEQNIPCCVPFVLESFGRITKIMAWIGENRTEPGEGE